jgi:hypothetical protein
VAERSGSFILVSKYQSPLFRIVRRYLHRHAIARQRLDPVSFHPAGGIGNELMDIIELNAVSGIRQYLGDQTLEFQQSFFRYVTLLLIGLSDAASFVQRGAASFRCVGKQLNRYSLRRTAWVNDGDLACVPAHRGASVAHQHC